ncbi:MAG: PUA domain-containing protein [Archaeoglobaceae archaeon]
MQKRLRKKTAKEVTRKLKETSGVEVTGDMDRVKVDGYVVIMVDQEPIIIEHDNRYYFTVYGALKYKPPQWKVMVDQGAMSFVMNGADVMKPGIVEADDNIKQDDFVYITVEGKDTPIAIGIALVDAKEMKQGKGKAIKNLHHLKDKVWNSFF